LEYFTGDHDDKNGAHDLKSSILTVIQILKKDLSFEHRKKRKGSFNACSRYKMEKLFYCFILVDHTTTTSSEMSDGEAYINKLGLDSLSDKLIGKRKRRLQKVSLTFYVILYKIIVFLG
jgi:hypothetical protein